MEYGDGRMDTSTSNITLKVVHKLNIISTQMSLLLDCSRTDQSIIYYPTFNRSYRNGWKIRSMTIKNELVHTISYKLHQYMPRIILVLLAQFMILPFCSLSNEFPGFSNLPLSNRCALKLIFTACSLHAWLCCDDLVVSKLARLLTKKITPFYHLSF